MDEKKIEETSPQNDDESNEVVGEIADDRLDGEENGDDEESEDAVSIFKKLLSMNNQKVAGEEAEASTDGSTDESSSEDDSVITPTRILNGRQVRSFTVTTVL